MRYALPTAILLAAVLASAASGGDRVLLAQNVQLTPVPVPQWLLQTATSATCTLGFDIEAMNCPNSCAPVGPVANPNLPGPAPRNLAFTTQPIACKQS